MLTSRSAPGEAEGDEETIPQPRVLPGRGKNLLHHCCLDNLLQRATSVYSEHVTLDLMAQLSLEVTQLLLQARQRRQNDGFGAQRAARLHVVIKPEGTSWGGSYQVLCAEVQNLRAPSCSSPGHTTGRSAAATSTAELPAGHKPALPCYSSSHRPPQSSKQPSGPSKMQEHL